MWTYWATRCASLSLKSATDWFTGRLITLPRHNVWSEPFSAGGDLAGDVKRLVRVREFHEELARFGQLSDPRQKLLFILRDGGRNGSVHVKPGVLLMGFVDLAEFGHNGI